MAAYNIYGIGAALILFFSISSNSL